ncbi:hypothetical protein OB13_10780 [Pontibacter sp. HJ8]
MKIRYNKASKGLLYTFLGLSMSLASCEEITDLAPNNSLTEESALTTADRVAQAVTGVYSAAQMGDYVGTGVARGYPFGAANTIQQDARGEDVIAIPSFYLITYEGSYSLTSANNQAMWETTYAMINRGNVVIEGLATAVTNGVITADQAKAYEAEIRFLRALGHHELLIHFARPYNHTADASHLGVPYRTIAVNTPAKVDEAAVQGRNTVKECYAKLIEDLNFAEENLPATRANALKVSRATKGAAIALKTRVYQHANNWAKVIEEGEKIVTGTSSFTSPIGGYALTPSPATPFVLANNYTNSESIFSIENNTNRNSGTNGALGAMYNMAPGRVLIAISPIIWNSPFWLPGDLRRTTLATNNGRGYFTTKYKDPQTWTDANPIIRYAEVLLNVAEARARTSALDPQALALLNAVRNRSVTTAADQYTMGSFASGNDLVRAILNERRIEFLAEGKRWGDIHRLATDPNFTTNGVPAKVSWTGTTFASWNAATPYTGARSVNAIPYDDYRFIWPIPQSELDANPVLKEQQNPNW